MNANLHCPKPRGNPRLDGDYTIFGHIIKRDGYHKRIVRVKRGSVERFQLNQLPIPYYYYLDEEGLKKNPELIR